MERDAKYDSRIKVIPCVGGKGRPPPAPHIIRTASQTPISSRLRPNNSHKTGFILSNVWFLFDNTEYFVLCPDLHKASNTCTVLYSHKVPISQSLLCLQWINLSHSHVTPAQEDLLDSTLQLDIIDEDSENTHKKNKSWQIITLKKYKVMENGKSLLLNYASNTPSYLNSLM